MKCSLCRRRHLLPRLPTRTSISTRTAHRHRFRILAARPGRLVRRQEGVRIPDLGPGWARGILRLHRHRGTRLQDAARRTTRGRDRHRTRARSPPDPDLRPTLHRHRLHRADPAAQRTVDVLVAPDMLPTSAGRLTSISRCFSRLWTDGLAIVDRPPDAVLGDRTRDDTRGYRWAPLRSTCCGSCLHRFSLANPRDIRLSRGHSADLFGRHRLRTGLGARVQWRRDQSCQVASALLVSRSGRAQAAWQSMRAASSRCVLVGMVLLGGRRVRS